MTCTPRPTPRWLLVIAAAVTLFAAPFADEGAAWAKGKKRRRSGRASAKKDNSAPALQYDRFRRQIELQVAEKREEQIDGLQRLIRLEPDEREMPDLKFRLAELFFEKSRFYFFRGQEAEGAALSSDDPSVKAERMAASKAAAKASSRWLQQALDLYRDIRERYPKYERGPEVLFALGQSYWSQGRFDEAVEAYADLIRTYRQHPLAAEAWLAFGEYYFNEGNIYKALKSYEKAAADKRSRVYGFALYKQAWCYYNLAEWKRALRLFRGTVLYSQLSDQLSGENRIALGREAQKDWVRTYSHVGEAKQARFQIADLLGVDDCTEARCRNLVEQLASLWFDEGYFEESAYLYRELIKLSPGSIRNAYFQARVVDLVSRSGNKKRVVKATRRLVTVYGAAKTAVAGTPSDPNSTEVTPAEAFEETTILAESTLRRLAQVWNREGKKTRNDKTLKYARTMYDEYLKLFGDGQPAYEMRFQLADLFYRLEEFDRAAAAYEATVLADPKGKYAADAANDNILAVEEHIKDLRITSPKLSGADPVPLHPQKKRLVEACDRYVEVVPGAGERTVAVKFKAGKVMYDYNQHPEALRRLDEVASNHPKSSQAEFAANLVIDVHNLREDWQALYDAARRYLASEPLIDRRPKLAQELAQFGEYAKLKLVRILEKQISDSNGDLSRVGQAYEDFTVEFPRSKNADKALFNASVAFDKAGRLERADGLRRRLLRQYSKSPLVADVSLYVAQRAADRADYEEAARAYLGFVRKFPKDKRARDALYNAAIFYAGLGKVRTANKLRQRYLKDFGRARGGRKEAAEIYWAIAKDLDRAGRWRSAADRYRDYAKEFPATDKFWEALWRESELRRTKLRQITAAEKIRKRLMGSYLYLKKRKRPLPDTAKLYASKVAFLRVDDDFKKYVRQRTRANPRSLKDKARARKRVIRLYTRVVSEFGQAETSIASLYRVARAWDVFVRALVGLPCPRRLDRDTCEAFKAGLEEEASPAREAAVAAYQVCVDKSNELATFTKYSSRCVKALEERAPDRYPPLVEQNVPYEAPLRIERLPARPMILDAPRVDPATASARAEGGPAR